LCSKRWGRDRDMELAELIAAGDRRAIARGISLVESQAPAARELLAVLFPRAGRAHIVGITGAPGVGKSTLVNALAQEYRRRGARVGIIAVDPSSPFSGGAILGDRIRMRDLAGDPGVFVRSMASRGCLGGLARATADAIPVVEAAGFETILVETVGAGQAEVEIAQAAHTVVVVLSPGMGDDIQAINAGLLEIADILVVNKSDQDGADQAAAVLEAMLNLAPPRVGPSGDAWKPPVLKVIATQSVGIAPLAQALEEHAAHLERSGQGRQNEQARAARELHQALREALWERFLAQARNALEATVQRVRDRQIDPYTAAEQLLRDAER